MIVCLNTALHLVSAVFQVTRSAASIRGARGGADSKYKMPRARELFPTPSEDFILTSICLS